MLPGIRISQLTAIGSVTDVPGVGGGSTGRFTPPRLNAANVWTGANDFSGAVTVDGFLTSRYSGTAGYTGRVVLQNADLSVRRTFRVRNADNALELLNQSGSAVTHQFLNNGGLLLNGLLTISGTQVLAGRRTGWAVPSGTATRSTFATSTVTVAQLAERVKALIDDLTAHGLIGA